MNICNRCIFDETTPLIKFDKKNVCNYCAQHDQLKEQYGTGNKKGLKVISKILEAIKKEGKGKKYDCIIGVSGGTDSSYMLDWAIENGLRPLAVHYDNTWNTAIATENIRKITTKLGVDLYTYIVDNNEMDDIYKSFFRAGVSEIDAATDLALAEVTYRQAKKHNLKYVLEGHSFVAEGILPIGKTYFDGKYIKSVHKKFGNKKIKTFPNMTFWTFIKWIIFYRIKKIRPLWYINYSKEEARDFLKKKFDWQYYGGHHLENRITAFAHSYLLPKKFNLDYRNSSLSASVRNKKISRKEALEEYYHTEPVIESDLIDYFKKRLSLSDDVFKSIMQSKPKNWNEFPTYKKRFERLRPIFKILADKNLVPMSFYLKYCFPISKQNQFTK